MTSLQLEMTQLNAVCVSKGLRDRSSVPATENKTLLRLAYSRPNGRVRSRPGV